MSEQQTAKLAGAIVEHQRHFDALPTEDRQWVIQNTVEAIGLFVEAVRNRGKQIVVKLLSFITTVQVSGTKKFVAKDQLKSANVGWTGSNFDRLFLNKVEEDVEAGELAIHKLEQRSLDAPILTELGRKRAKVQLAHFFQLLKKQSKGQAGTLLVNGYANVAYVEDESGNLWAVRALWYGDRRCWRVEAGSVEYSYGWLAGRQVLSQVSGD